MKRTTGPLGIGAALFAATLITACGGGSPATNVPGTTVSQPGGGTAQSALKVQLVIPRGVQRHGAGANRKGSRPLYVSPNAQGLQLSVSVPATNVTQTFYIDLQAGSSPLCTGSSQPNPPIGSEETCTIPLPVLGATETLTAVEVDVVPTAVNRATGFGTGFASGGRILAIGSTTANTTGFNNTVALGLGAVAASLIDCEHSSFLPPPTQNFADDEDNNSARLVVTAGAPASGTIGMSFLDPDCGWYDAVPTPAPGATPLPAPEFVDVNGSPEPITYAASTSAISLGLWPSAGVPPTSSSQSGQIATDGAYEYDQLFMLNVNVDALPTPNALPVGNPTAPPTIVFSNNLSATPPPPFIGPTTGGSVYTASLTYALAPLWAYPSTMTTSISGAGTTVTGFDYDAANGMNAESSYGRTDISCDDTSNNGNADAIIVGSGAISNGLEQFTVTGQIVGTCTFVLYDQDTGVVTLPVTVTVTP